MPRQIKKTKKGGEAAPPRRAAAPGRKIMTRRASDNAYLHRDFHGALNQALFYLERQFGAAAVGEYISQFGRTFYAPLTEDIRARGLEALRDHFVRIYAEEGAPVRIDLSPDELVLTVAACPAVTHIRKMGLPISSGFRETARALHAAVCEGTGFDYELLEYDPASGRSVERFSRRRA